MTARKRPEPVPADDREEYAPPRPRRKVEDGSYVIEQGDFVRADAGDEA